MDERGKGGGGRMRIRSSGNVGFASGDMLSCSVHWMLVSGT